MKKLLSILFILILTISVFLPQNMGNVSAASNITIYVNDFKQAYSNKAIVKNGATLVPLRGIFEALGADVRWDQSSKTIDASRGNTKIWLKIGSKSTKINGTSVNIDVPAQVVNDSTLVPIRFISESLGAKVEWIPTSKTVKIIQNGTSTSIKPTPDTETSGNPGSGSYVVPGAPTSFKNCDDMREYYPNGVKKGHPAYGDSQDRDKDGWACEK